MTTPEFNPDDLDPHDVDGRPPEPDDQREVPLVDESRDEEILPDEPRPEAP